jgi:hypothetical protein
MWTYDLKSLKGHLCMAILILNISQSFEVNAENLAFAAKRSIIV